MLISQAKNILLQLLYQGSLIFGVIAIVFLLFSVLPSDPARLMLGVNASEEAVALLRHELGLDRPSYKQFFSYLGNLGRLDLGNSYVTRRPVANDILDGFLATSSYVILALCLSITLSIVAGTLGFFSPWVTSRLIQPINSLLTSIPSLVIAIFVGVTFLYTNMFFFIDLASIRNTLSAAIALAVYPGCSLSQILVNEISMTLRKQYTTAATSFGTSRGRLFINYVLRNSLLPWMAQLSNVIASLVTGSIVIELVFSLPGLGRIIAQSVLSHDYPMIQGVVIVTSLTFLFLNAAMEYLYRLFFPLVRES